MKTEKNIGKDLEYYRVRAREIWRLVGEDITSVAKNKDAIETLKDEYVQELSQSGMPVGSDLEVDLLTAALTI